VDIIDPTPAAARNAAHNLARTTLLDPIRVEDLVMAVSETVSNSLLYGRPPVRLRLWAVPHRVVAAISDRGAGPTDPFAGLLPAPNTTTTGGLGLWLTHQICDHVMFDTSDAGFTVRLVFEMPAAGGDGHAARHA
jgi:anti-sigma regulatory factor (Ser/Thr protein kinase)